MEKMSVLDLLSEAAEAAEEVLEVTLTALDLFRQFLTAARPELVRRR